MILNRFARCLSWGVLLVLLAMPAFALDEIYLVRHAEKADFWPADRELDPFQPLSAAGLTRAEALASRLKTAGIAGVWRVDLKKQGCEAITRVAR